MFKLPRRIDELLPAAAVEKVLDVLHQPELAAGVREALGKVGVKDLNPIDKMQEAWRQTRTWLDGLAGSGSRSRTSSSVLNATGQLFRPGLEGVPMASVVAFAYTKAATTFQSTDLAMSKAQEVAKACFGCPHVAWLSTPPAALLLLARQINGKEFVIGRSDMLRVEHLGDIRLMLELCGLPVSEVGATNGSASDDWTRAVHSKEQIVLLVSPNGLSKETAAEQSRAAIEAARRVGARVIEVLIDGVSSRPLAEAFGFPLVQQRLAAGVDFLLLPTHFFIAGPSGIVLASMNTSLDQVQRDAVAAGAAMEGSSLAAMVTALQLENLADEVETAASTALLTNSQNLRDRARRLAVQLDGIEQVQHAIEVERKVALGSPPWDRYQLLNWAVELTPRESERQLLSALAKGDPAPPILSVSENGKVLLDLRFIPPSMDHELVNALRGADSPPESQPSDPAAPPA